MTTDKDTPKIKLLKFLQSFGTYGILGGIGMTVVGILNGFEVHLTVVGIIGALLSVGWVAIFEWLITKNKK